MTFIIHLRRSNLQFSAEADEVILDAAERAGIILTHSCRGGTCRACITQVVSGCIEHDPEYADELSIDGAELEAGFRLLCSALAFADSALER